MGLAERLRRLFAPSEVSAGRSQGDDGPVVDGIKAAEEQGDEDAAYERAVLAFMRTQELEERRATQVIGFESGPVALAFLGDQHLGDAGTDVEWCMKDAQLVRDTPGMWAAILGDTVNNFVWPSLLPVRLIAEAPIPDEWALARRFLRVLGPKLVLSVGGNHEGWTKRLAGIDYWREVVASVRPECIYDADDARLDVRVGSRSWRMRVRHKWRGSSIYNPSHGIERAFKWDQDFEIGVGGHTHASGVVRSFNAAGSTGWAAMVGSYKRVDEFARRGGFAKANGSAAVALLFDEVSGRAVGFDDLGLCARVLTAMRSEEG